VESYLPGRQRSAVQFSHADSEAPEPGDEPLGATILVVDNLPVNLELARSILVPSGYRVITADGLAAAITLARKPGCHLILSDVCINNESGFDFLRAIKADPQLQRIPFVLITSTMMDHKDHERGLAMGAARYLRRPMEPESLLAEIRACLTEAGVS
jgi:CheY-like chemotaxis protein